MLKTLWRELSSIRARKKESLSRLDSERANRLLKISAVARAEGRLRDAARAAVDCFDLEPRPPGLTSSLYALFENLSVRGDRDQTFPQRDDFIDHFARGSDHLRDADFLGAEESFLESLSRKPDWPFTWQRLGCLFALRGDLERADECFRRSGEAYLWPDTNIRLGSAFFGTITGAASRYGKCIDWSSCEATVGDPTAVVFVCGDPVYFRRFVHALVGSALGNGNVHLSWHLHVINPDEWICSELLDLARVHTGLQLRITTETRTFLSPEQAKTYFASARFLYLPEFLRKYQRPVLQVDLDILVLAPIAPLLNSMSDADVGIVDWGSDQWRVWDRIWASVVLARPTRRSEAFFARIADYVAHFLENGQAAWYLDQIALFAGVAANKVDSRPANVALIPTAMCSLHHVSGVNPGAGVVFWSVTFNIAANATAVDAELFRRWLPKTRRLYGWTLPGTDQVFQQYLMRSPSLDGRKIWDFEILNLCEKLLKRHRRAVDVGAHIGFSSFWLAARFETVDAFEPSPLSQQCFTANVQSPNVTLHRCALGRDMGGVDLEFDSSNSGMNHVVPGKEGAIPMLTLDSFGYDDIDFMKLDTEGYECLVLEGAVHTLTDCHPLILIEQDDRWSSRYGVEPRAALAFLRGLGAEMIAELPDSNYLMGWPTEGPFPVIKVLQSANA